MKWLDCSFLPDRTLNGTVEFRWFIGQPFDPLLLQMMHAASAGVSVPLVSTFLNMPSGRYFVRGVSLDCPPDQNLRAVVSLELENKGDI